MELAGNLPFKVSRKTAHGVFKENCPGGIPQSVTQGPELLATCLLEKHLHHAAPPPPQHSSKACPRSTQNQGTTLFPPLWPVQQSLPTKPDIRPSGEEMLCKGPSRVSTEQGESMNLDLIAGPGRECATAQTWGALVIDGRRIQVRQDFHCRDLHKPRKKTAREPERELGA